MKKIAAILILIAMFTLKAHTAPPTMHVLEEQPYFHFECEVKNKKFVERQASAKSELLKIYNTNSPSDVWSNLLDADAECNDKECYLNNGCDNSFVFTPDQEALKRFKNKELNTDLVKIKAVFFMNFADNSEEGYHEATETVSCVVWATKNPIEEPLYMGETIKRKEKIKNPDGKPGIIER
ncbi:MAG: hypothetical protein V4596_03100 [Bdellovibrionota bacterium]